MAVMKPRIDLNNRTPLQTVIPLETPFIINIDPCDTCNFRCKFCPTGDRNLMRRTPGRGHGLMNFDLYRKIIDELAEFPNKVKVVRLYKDGEPLLNPKFADMVKYAKGSGCCLRVDTTTNASFLTPELSLAIIEAGLDRINISIEGTSSELYAEFSGIKLDFQGLVKNIAYFYEHRRQCEMIVKSNGDILTDDQKQRFFDVFGSITDGIFIESVMDCWPLFEQSKVPVNKTRGIYGQRIREVSVCPYVFYSFAINSDGSASVCFLDWSRKLLIGDICREPVKSLWNVKILRDLQTRFLKGERKKHPVCSNCGQLSQGQPDDIDAFAEELLDRLNG
jgi:MoaA/NifB/PqqE/SkfB family radical SAM enzyme